ncbi:MAG: beta-galactosidase [Armatimonadetes bacterium]|nr:beta-galactosidase [Armatimonadota bacterium]
MHLTRCRGKDRGRRTGGTPRAARAPSPVLLALLAAVAAAAIPGRPAAAREAVPRGLAWCGRALTPEDLAACRAAGFDAVRVDVPWQASPAWEGTDAQVAAAREQGLRVILAPRMAAPPPGAGLPDPDDEEYRGRLKLWIEGVVEHFRGNETVLAWMAPDEPEQALQLTDAGLRRYLAGRYREVAALNQAWGTRYRALPDISSAGVLVATQPRALGISRAGTDMALYRRQALVRLMELWARFLHAADERRPVLTGATGRYRSLISVPEGYDGVVARVAPPLTPGGEPAAESVAIASRSGRFTVIASLPPSDLLNALGGAILHGAAGVAVEDGRALRANPLLRTKLKAALDGWRGSLAATRMPRPTAAILYEPFADSHPTGSPYFTGYLAGADAGELEPLFAALRRGTPFGQVGFLAQEDLGAERLSGYRVLFCPMALSLSGDDLQTLSAFVVGGGVLVADVGFGCYEVGGETASWSVPLAALLGFRALWPPIPAGGALRIYEKCDLFPSLLPGVMTAPTGGGVPPFGDLATLIEPLVGSTVFAATVDRSMWGRRMYGGLLVRSLGKGWTVFSSMKLWQRWSPSDPLYQAFHRDLLARSPVVALRDAPLLGGDVQVAAFEGGLAAHHTGTRSALVAMDVPGEDLYAGPCLNECRGALAGSTVVHAGLKPGALGLYERVPIRCLLPRGTVTVAVECYGPEGVKLALCGGKPRLSLSAEGRAVMEGSSPQSARLVIGDGRYPVRPDSLHRVRVKDLETGRAQEHTVRVGANGRIELDKEFGSDVITVTPAPTTEGSEGAAPQTAGSH